MIDALDTAIPVAVIESGRKLLGDQETVYRVREFGLNFGAIHNDQYLGNLKAECVFGKKRYDVPSAVGST